MYAKPLICVSSNLIQSHVEQKVCCTTGLKYCTVDSKFFVIVCVQHQVWTQFGSENVFSEHVSSFEWQG